MNRTLVIIIKSGLFTAVAFMLAGLILHALFPETQQAAEHILAGLMSLNPYSYLHAGMYIVVAAPPAALVYILAHSIINGDKLLSILCFIAIIILAIVVCLKM